MLCFFGDYEKNRLDGIGDNGRMLKKRLRGKDNNYGEGNIVSN